MQKRSGALLRATIWRAEMGSRGSYAELRRLRLRYFPPRPQYSRIHPEEHPEREGPVPAVDDVGRAVGQRAGGGVGPEGVCGVGGAGFIVEEREPPRRRSAATPPS